MKVIQASHEILDEVDGHKILSSIERYGRVCYKSESKITDSSSQEFVRRILCSGHESVIEHEKVSVRIICDRGVSHEIVRHRIASYSQESTRYCNYSNEKFGKELTLIKPYFWDEEPEKYAVWEFAMKCIEDNYNKLIEMGASPQEARSILPNSLKTEIIVSMNLRSWRHFFKLRTSSNAHPQMREVAIPLLHDMQKLIPIIFDDITAD
jgi:thymidylate synthase (FAD)